MTNVPILRWRLSADVDLYNTRDRTQDTQDVKTKSKILQDIQDPRSYQEIQDRFQEYICRTCRSSASNASSN